MSHAVRIVALAFLLCAPAAAEAATTFTTPTGPIRPGQQVVFAASGGACAAPAVCVWASSDGELAIGGSFAHAFALVGTYTVALQVDPTPGTDPGDVTTETATVTVVANRDPTVSVGVAPAAPVTGEPVIVTAVAADPDGDPLTYAWDTDGDGLTDASGPTASFLAPAGSRTVTLTVRDAFGGVAVASRTVRIATAPLAGISAPATAVPGEPLTLTSTAHDPDGTIADADQQWDLDGDGAYDDAVGPVTRVAFPSTGVFTVALQVRDSDGLTAYAFRDVTVAVPASSPVAAAAAPQSRTPASAPPPAPAVSVMRPRPLVRIAGRFDARGTRFTRFDVRAPSAARVRITCTGAGCPWQARTVRPGRVRSLEGRLLRPGARLVVRVTRARTIGKYTRITIRRARPPLRVDRCLRPGGQRPVACSGA